MHRNRPGQGSGHGGSSSSSQALANKNKNVKPKNDISSGANRPMSSGALTRARSHSASSSKTSNSNSGSSSSGGTSSSSSASSSSSSGSGSDSSSSDTEASRASSQSRASRSSRRSQSSNKATTARNTSTNAIPGPSKTQQSKSQKNSSSSVNSPQVPTQSHKKAKTGTGNVIVSGAVSNNIPTTQLVNRSRNRPPLSGSVTNVKTPTPVARVAPTRPFSRKSFAATSSESESSSAVATPVKRVGSKPPSIPVTMKRPPSVPLPSTSTSIVTVGKKPAARSMKATVSSAPKKGSGLTNGKINSVPAKNQKKLLKSIFSPVNSSADSEDDKPQPPRKKTNESNSGPRSPGINSTSGRVVAKKSSIASRFKKGTSPAPITRRTSSSSLSATSTGSSSSSSSDSSSESDKKPAEVINTGGGKPSPRSPSGSGRKRPVTRRQMGSTVKNKTIPTTTMFSQSVISPSPMQISAWDSDFSDEPRSLVRVPAKSSHKSRPRPTDDEEDMMERERRCRFPGCDSSGHLSGRFPTHSLLSTCPKYAGFSVEECKENAAERQKRETERKKHFCLTQPLQKKQNKLSTDAKNWLEKMKDLKTTETKDGLCSEYDLSLWNDSLALAAARIEIEQGEAISFRSVAVGRFEMSCWCESPYAEPLSHSRRLFICEFCLKPVQSGTVLRRHCAKCVWRHPPGDEIYRKDRLSVWEVDGKTQKTYCQNLCLLAKCFLDHKTLYLDVDPFLFYVMTLADSQGCHLVGYFSKEKNSFLQYNVSCILTLPPYQRQGFGRLLIDFSYLLTRVEGKVGSPEKPLSDLGLISYRSYWKDAVLRRMCACATREMNVKDLSIELGVQSADLISTLQFLGMLKYWKGKHLVLKKTDVLEEYLERVRRRGETRQIEPSCLRWRPFQPPAETSS